MARDLGFPVVMKINSPDITHKADVGGVRFHIHSESEVLAAFHELIEDVRAQRPEARILGVTVQEQEKSPDCELLIGSKQDPDFGPLILFGAGGAFTEVLAGCHGGPAAPEPAAGPEAHREDPGFPRCSRAIATSRRRTLIC